MRRRQDWSEAARSAQAAAIEVVFWAVALAVVLFINISPKALTSANPLFLKVTRWAAVLGVFLLAASCFAAPPRRRARAPVKKRPICAVLRP